MILDGFKVLTEIAGERTRQDEIWGGAKHDDRNSDADWIEIADLYLTRAATAPNNKTFREKMVQVAAIAVAAIESVDRSEARKNEAIKTQTENNQPSGTSVPKPRC